MKQHHHYHFRAYYYGLRLLYLIEKEFLHLIELLKKKEMDSTQLQQTVDNLKAAIVNDQAQLDKDNADLATAEAELAQVSLINALEALTPDEVGTVNTALASDPSNTSGISLTLPNIGPETEPQV